jgi:hypothetical protein
MGLMTKIKELSILLVNNGSLGRPRAPASAAAGQTPSAYWPCLVPG